MKDLKLQEKEKKLSYAKSGHKKVSYVTATALETRTFKFKQTEIELTKSKP